MLVASLRNPRLNWRSGRAFGLLAIAPAYRTARVVIIRQPPNMLCDRQRRWREYCRSNQGDAEERLLVQHNWAVSDDRPSCRCGKNLRNSILRLHCMVDVENDLSQ